MHTSQLCEEGDLLEGRVIPNLAVEMLLCDEDVVPDDLIDPEGLPGQTTLPSMTPADWYKLQREDVAIIRVISLVESGETLTHADRLNESKEVSLMLREKPRLSLLDGVMYRMVSDQYGQNMGSWSFPLVSETELLKECMMKLGIWVMKELWSLHEPDFIGLKWQNMWSESAELASDSSRVSPMLKGLQS